MKTNFEEFVAGYLECAAWSSTSDEHEGLEQFEFAPCAVLQAQHECREFIAACGPLIEQAAELREWSTLGHDFWLSRAGHGVGFSDRDELETEACATVYGVKRWGGCNFSTESRGEYLGDALHAIAYGTSAAISHFAYASCDLGDDELIYFS